MPAGGLEPPHPAKDFGFKDHCVYHSAMRALALAKSTLSILQGAIRAPLSKLWIMSSGALDGRRQRGDEEMLWLALLAAAATADPGRGPWDKYTGPYKLVITWYQGGIVVTDYPNRARCEAGREAVLKRMMAGAVKSGLPAESGDIAFCIPG